MQLQAALSALYRPTSQSEQKEADQWLENWKMTVEAWSISDAVLHDPTSSMEAHSFCAQTLRTKVCALVCYVRGLYNCASSWACDLVICPVLVHSGQTGGPCYACMRNIFCSAFTIRLSFSISQLCCWFMAPRSSVQYFVQNHISAKVASKCSINKSNSFCLCVSDRCCDMPWQ